jgi:hypothetical protein
LAARGYRMSGFDLSHPALNFLRRRLARRGLRANVTEADMTDFRLPKPVDAAFCTVNTFRLLLTEQAAQGHLECISECLRPGGIYILGFHLLPMDASLECTERWTEQQGRTKVTVTLRVLSANRRQRIEQIRVSTLARVGTKEIRLRDEFAFRMYTAAQFRKLLKSVPSLELCDVYDFWYEIDNPTKLNNDCADTVFVLRKRVP